MAKSDEGEFELILGNRQLISVFLIVVVLLGVFFSMGYIVGRNSSAPVADAHNTAKTVPVDPPTSEPSPSATAAAPAPEPSTSPSDTVSPPTGTTHPEQPAATKPAPEKPSPTKSAATVKPSPVAPPKAKPAPAGGLATITHDPPPGQYWQVVATSRPDAEIVSEVLNRKGFHALVAPSPKEGIFRVIVGPLPNAESQAQTRTKLEAAGFKNSIIKRY